MAIVFLAGTTAELIKLAPVMKELSDQGRSYRLWSTSQHVVGVRESLAGLAVRDPDRYLVAEGRRAHIAAPGQVPGWVVRVWLGVLRDRGALRRELRNEGGRGVVVVHGDTFTTVLGALIGRFLGARVAHVEAGLRSGSWRTPFPEELNRRIVAMLATLHFAPTEVEVDNLRRSHAPGETVLTGANTVVDALRLAAREEPDDVELPDGFGLVTLHRFELLRQGDHLSDLLRVLAEHAEDHSLVMLVGLAERDRIEELGLSDLFGRRFRMIPKRPYAQFLPILARADFVVTDSGGLQEECAAIGLPCAVHRERTERQQGIGQNVVLTRLSLDALGDFLENWRDYARPSTLGELTPSRIIAERLLALR